MGYPSTVLLFCVGLFGFFSGSLVTMYSGLTKCHNDTERLDPMKQCAHVVEPIVQQRLMDMKEKLSKECDAEKKKIEAQQMAAKAQRKVKETTSSSSQSAFKFPPSMSRYLVGMARTDKMDFINTLDLGVPIDDPENNPRTAAKEKDVLVLYQKPTALPTDYDDKYKQSDDSGTPPIFSSEEALEHCEYVNVILTDHSAGRNQCWAMVPQYESYHVQKWMRFRPMHQMNPKEPLRLVSRGMKTSGRNDFDPPARKHIDKGMDMLQNYFKNLVPSLAELEPLLKKVATPKNTVTIMVVNFGQSELLVNHVCASKSRGLDTSSILVFATDEESKDLASSLGLTVFYDEPNFGAMPKEEAGSYGDRKFTAMMMAKIFCVHMVSRLKYNILFQDVDIVWYKNPIEYFESNHMSFDLLFQDDGGHSVRYAPYSANSGFYYVRYNERSEYLFHSLLLSGDLILSTNSHQQALIATMNEHVSRFGLRVKVFSRDSDEFPGGYQFHQASGKYMRRLFAGEVDPFIFHMSWTLNKNNKLLFLRQLGEWYVQDQCVHKTTSEVMGSGLFGGGKSFLDTCCAAEPLFSCHYRDKPSLKPCKDSPPIDGGKKSWWK